jgi:serine/threonine protein kinase
MIFRQLVEAVKHCHNSGIFHRDIKTENILIDFNTHEVKLLDFDLSAPARYSPFEDNPGTLGYMSPEMYGNSAKYEGSPAAVYSMGVVLYDIVFRAHEWNFFNSRRPMPRVSNECLDLICKMTAIRPEERLPFDKILDHPWMQSNKKTCVVVDEIEAEKELTDVTNQHAQPASTPSFTETDKETNNISFVSSLEVDDESSTTQSSIADDQWSSMDDDESVAFEKYEGDDDKSSCADHQTTSADDSSMKPTNRSMDYGGVIAVRPAVVRSGEFTTILWNYTELAEKFEHDGLFLDVPPLHEFILKRLQAKGTLRAGQLLIRRRKLNESSIIYVLRHYARMYKKIIFSSMHFNQANIDKLRCVIRETSNKYRKLDITIAFLSGENDVCERGREEEGESA